MERAQARTQKKAAPEPEPTRLPQAQARARARAQAQAQTHTQAQARAQARVRARAQAQKTKLEPELEPKPEPAPAKRAIGARRQVPQQVEEMLHKFTREYKKTHAQATREIEAGCKRSCWSWWIWPTNYRPGASGTSASWALTDEQATAFITDSYLRGCWMKMMSAVAEQLEKGVALNLLCGIDAPRIPATCELMHRAAVLKDREVHKLCARVKGAMSTDVGARKKRAGGGSMQCCGGAAANSPASQR
jgi:uncharacterized protein (DUF1810 family)